MGEREYQCRYRQALHWHFLFFRQMRTFYSTLTRTKQCPQKPERASLSHLTGTLQRQSDLAKSEHVI